MKKMLMKALKAAIVVAIVYFLVVELRRQHFSPLDVWHYLQHANGYFYWSMLVFTSFLMMQAMIWVEILNRPVKHLRHIKGMTIYINSQFVKYMPGGGVLNFLGRFYLTSREGVPMSRQVITIFQEGVLLTLAASLYAFALVYSLHWIPVWSILGLLLFMGVLYYYYTPLSTKLEVLVHRYIKKFKDYNLHLPRKDFFQVLIYFLISHLVMGLSYYLLLRSFGVENVSLLYATGTFALSWLLGIISPLPGGIGIREAAMTLLLQRLGVDYQMATLISIITRIWNMLAEVLFFAIINSLSILLDWRKVKS
jgi:uncharacterized membrane protein YbhN (UPF0104 family)